jgi:hypothetical protein
VTARHKDFNRFEERFKLPGRSYVEYVCVENESACDLCCCIRP